MQVLARRSFYNPVWLLRKITLWSRSYFSYNESDIILALFPKTGSTWIRFFIYNLLSLREDLDARPTLDQMNAIMPEFGNKNMFSTKWPFKDVSRLVKTHRPYNVLLKNNQVVLVIRDPRDIVVSYFHYAVNKKEINFTGTIKDIIYHPEMGLNAFFKHYNSWRNKAGLVLQYEKLKENPFHEFSKLVDFCNLKVTDEIVQLAISLSDLKHMREAQKNSNKFKEKFKDEFVFARSGASSQWVGLFDVDDIAYWEKLKGANDLAIYE